VRLRLRYQDWPRPVIRLEDTPNPNCPDCEGTGEIPTGGDEDGPFEAAGCNCWTWWRRWTLLRLPRWVARRRRWPDRVYSDEAPF
jgi:hypothetical protein